MKKVICLVVLMIYLVVFVYACKLITNDGQRQTELRCNGCFKMIVLDDAPSPLEEGMLWLQLDGLHVYVGEEHYILKDKII